MLLSKMKQLFIVGFLGLTLVGCSSIPTVVEDTSAQEQADADAKTAAAAQQFREDAAEQARVEAIAAEKSAAIQAEKIKSQNLLAQLQGQVVRFDFDRYEIKEEFYRVIKMNADYLSMNTNASVTLSGHADERGTREYNLALGERRADAVKNALIAAGVSPGRINTISFGEEKPIALGQSEQSWSQNRRVEFSY